MLYRELGSTGLKVSEIGLGGEWVDGTPAEALELVRACEKSGINILDCWMNDARRRSNLGDALQALGSRERWIIQGHLGSTTVDGQYTRTRQPSLVRPAFEDLLARFHTDYIDLGIIHYMDKPSEFREIMDDSPFIRYIRKLKAAGTIHHVGLSTHNPQVARLAVEHPEIEMILFSINPAFDMKPATDDLDAYFDKRGERSALGRTTSERAELYALAEQTGTGITVMKGYMGGRLFDAASSPFGVALTPLQCLHYALTRPAVASVMVGFSSPRHVADAVAYETATEEERDYTHVLAAAPRHAYLGQCTYCGHCAPCPQRIDIPTVNKFYDLASLHEHVPESVREHYRALGDTAEACVGCHACEARCPFGVPVAEKMSQAARLFGR